jgi:hypothetical protein
MNKSNRCFIEMPGGHELISRTWVDEVLKPNYL